MKKTAVQILLEKKDKWTLIEKHKTGFSVKCNKCNKEQKVSSYMLINNKDECFCSSDKGKKMAKKEAMKMYHYIAGEAYDLGYGMLEGEELHSYIIDVLKIESPVLAMNQEFCEMVIDAMYEIYKEKKVQRCVDCGKLYPACRMYKKACLKKFKDKCVA